MNKIINIVSLDIPYPANYGGVIDIFYKIKALHLEGYDIHLHCFQYDSKSEQSELNQYCKSVTYYPRKKNILSIISIKPFIVYSRRNKTLLKNLLRNKAPILFEGIHTTYYLNHSLLENRYKIVRLHNVEQHYYKALYKSESSILKKIFFAIESLKLRCYEKKLHRAQAFLPIAAHDFAFFKSLYPRHTIVLLHAFHPYQDIQTVSGLGAYCLYHGNLRVQENIDAVKFLCTKVFNTLSTPLVIAGKSPHHTLKNFVSDTIHIIADPSEIEMKNLIQNAQIIVLPTFQTTGMKLKLVESLCLGRHILVNKNMIIGTTLDKAVHVFENEKDCKQLIQAYIKEPLVQSTLNERNAFIKDYFPHVQIKKLVELI
ncbi:MAG: mannosyltransferase [Chitinophagaceae bacterium]